MHVGTELIGESKHVNRRFLNPAEFKSMLAQNYSGEHKEWGRGPGLSLNESFERTLP